jgi:hypothetical protein
LYVEDALPPNNLPFERGNILPPITPTLVDSTYFRLEYTGLSKNIPARLYRYKKAKGRWIHVETDRREQNNPTKPVLQEFLTSPTRIEESSIFQRDIDYCGTTNSPAEPDSVPVK